jgi:phage tail protein X
VASLAPPQGAWFVPKYPELMPPDMPATQGVGATGVKVLPSVASLATNQHHGAMVHRVRPGDTMYGLARQYYGDAGLWRLLLDANRAAIPDPARLSSGVLVYLPTEPLRSPDGRLRPPGRCPDYYVVAPGDTLGFIAETFLGRREAYSDLARHNRLATPDQIAPGMMLAIATP